MYTHTHTHTHTHTLAIRFFGPPNTQSDTELFIGKLHRTSASGIYTFFFYIFILFVLKIPPLRCARIILSCITLNVTVSLLYTYIYIYYINVWWFTVIYIYIIRRAVLVPAVEGLLRARVAIVYNNIYDVYVHEICCNGIRSRIRICIFPKCDTI
jgi:hypothetical protein